MRFPRPLAVVGSLAALVSIAVACSSDDGRELPPARPDQVASVLTTTTVAPTTATLPADTLLAPAEPFDAVGPWPSGGEIPAQYTCVGAPQRDVSPRISWTGVPADTIEMAVVITDADANEFVHWVIGGIDPREGGLTEGVIPAGAWQATNGGGTVGYIGPCPPSGTHNYIIDVFAISQQLEFSDGDDAATAIAAITAAAIDRFVITGFFTLPEPATTPPPTTTATDATPLGTDIAPVGTIPADTVVDTSTP